MYSILFGVVTLIGCGAIVVQLFRFLGRRQAVAGTAMLVVLLVLVPSLMMLAALSESPQPVQLDDVAYRTSVSCKKCHADQYASWHQSFHRTMTQEVLPENVRGDFDDVTLTFKGLECRLVRRGDRFSMNLIDPFWESAVIQEGRVPAEESSNPPRVTYSVDRLVGSHVMQVYLTKFPNGEYWTLPLVWHCQEERWVTREGIFLSSPCEALYSFNQAWNNNCAFCHNTKNRPRLLVDPNAPLERYVFNTKLEEMGIACEACHGPGDQHVRANQNPGRRFVVRSMGRDDPTIVNPAKLSQQASIAICSRCHGQWHAKQELLPEWLSTGDFFVPGGEPLEANYSHHFSFPSIDGDDATPETGYFWGDWTPQSSALEALGLEVSACFQGGELTCASCHTMHGPRPEDQLIFPDDERVDPSLHNAACLKCHEEFSDPASVTTHTHHAADSSGSRCLNCHMPFQTYGLLKAIRTHRISSPSARKTAEIALPNACNQCHVDQSLQWTSQWLARWYGHEVPTLSEDQREISATVIDMFRGHALNRALAVARLGWQSAYEAAPGRWPVPLLTRSLDDSYAAVRFIAYRSLRAFPAFDAVEFDYLADPETRLRQTEAIRDRWRSLSEKGLPDDPRSVLLKSNGEPDAARIGALLEQQDQTEFRVFE